MEALQLNVALRILEHAEIPACIIGEIALNYYNVPRVLHDIEICVPETLVPKAASLFHETGLFKPEEIEDFDIYNDYKRGCPRFRSSSWVPATCALVLLADRSYGLNPLLQNIVSRDNIPSSPAYSSQITDLISAAEVHRLPIPRLPALFAGLCQRFLDTHDDVAMIAAEQLVDGMNLDEGWCERNLRNASPAALQLAITLAAGRHSRIDNFSGSTVTCFIANDEEVERLRRIPGYE